MLVTSSMWKFINLILEVFPNTIMFSRQTEVANIFYFVTQLNCENLTIARLHKKYS